MSGFWGWLAFVLNVWGNLKLTNRSGRMGWIIRLLVNVLWIPYSIQTQAWALLANHLTFMGINVYGWFTWKEKPVDMVLFCPYCGTQHIDEPKGDWLNPPHRTHQCQRCDKLWRPAQIATNGVRAI